MGECQICQHAKIKAIDAALDAKRPPNLVRAQYRLEPQMFVVHLTHRTAPEKLIESVVPLNGLSEQSLPDDPMRLVKYHIREAACAWREVEEARRTTERLEVILQEAFAEPDMGL